MRLWITKYALSAGIIEVDAEIRESLGGKPYMSALLPTASYSQGFYGGDFQLTAEAAKSDSERRRAEKIASLKKQIAKLEKLKF